jgi:hypothetical protein
MNMEWYAHLPGVSLIGLHRFDIGRGHITHLSFESWRKLDSSFSFSESHYKHSKPVFYAEQTNVSEDPQLAEKEIMNSINLLHLSFLLGPEAPILPSPHMSAIYLKRKSSDSGSAYRSMHIGDFEREWIIFGNKIDFKFNKKRLSYVQNMYEFLSKFDQDKAFSGVVSGLDTLILTTLPEFWWFHRSLNSVNAFIHCMAALEQILLPAKEEPSHRINLTTTFGQNAAVCISPNRNTLKEQEKMFSALYRLRSRLIHGEIGISDLIEEELKQLWLGRSLLCNVIIFAIRLQQKMNTEKSLPYLLSEAYRDPDVHGLLFRQAEAR